MVVYAITTKPLSVWETIGTPDVWGSEKYFNQVKDWAANVGPLEEHSRAVMREAEANEKSRVESSTSRMSQLVSRS